ncbi:MAG: CPBP family intramembrane metalloprotease [Clostridiales bacterium]|nr:CPBP family intramembrane metalloprotease [Clostridiales bacterium]
MAENDLQDNIEVKAEPAPEKKGKKIGIGYVFLSFIPFAAIMAMQSAAVIPGVILALIDLSKNGQDFDFTLMLKVFNEKYGIFCYLGYCAAAIGVFLLWYYKSFVKKDPKISYKKALGLKPVILTVAVMICTYFTVNGVFTFAFKIFPEAMKKYAELMEMASIGSNMWITVVYGILLGPIAEELCFRGIVFKYLEKSKLHFMFVIFIQAVLFGVMHSNLIQGIYASALGMLLGYLRYKYKTVLITIGAHMLFNFLGTIVAIKTAEAGFTDEVDMILGAVFIFFTAGVILLIAKDKRICYKQEEAA